MNEEQRLKELAWLFLRLGTISFGGPAAHTALMQDEVVRRRKWMSNEEFLDLLGATNLIPGPNSTELAIHIGNRRAGWRGLIVAGVCFILPAASIVAALAWVYVSYGSFPAAEGLLYGVKPAIIAVVGQALYALGLTALKTRWLALLASAAAICIVLGVNELAVLFGAGLLSVVASRPMLSGRSTAGLFPIGLLHPLLALQVSGGFTANPFSINGLFLFFLKVGSVLFGSGYVLLAFIRADLVERWGWLTETQLLDAIAIGQVTPGPVFTTATFIGYVLGGWKGSVVATIGIFLPAFVFVALSGPLVPRIRKSSMAGAFLDGVNGASLALMAVVTWSLGRSAVVDVVTIAIAVASAIALFRFRLNSAWIIIGGGAAGLLSSKAWALTTAFAL